MRVGVGLQPKEMGDPTAAGGARARGAGGVHSARWGNPRDGGRAGGRLTPEIDDDRGDISLRFVGDVVTFKDMREFLVAYSEYER